MVRIELTFSCAQDTRATGAPHPEFDNDHSTEDVTVLT